MLDDQTARFDKAVLREAEEVSAGAELCYIDALVGAAKIAGDQCISQKIEHLHLYRLARRITDRNSGWNTTTAQYRYDHRREYRSRCG